MFCPVDVHLSPFMRWVRLHKFLIPARICHRRQSVSWPIMNLGTSDQACHAQCKCDMVKSSQCVIRDVEQRSYDGIYTDSDEFNIDPSSPIPRQTWCRVMKTDCVAVKRVVCQCLQSMSQQDLMMQRSPNLTWWSEHKSCSPELSLSELMN